MSIEIGEYRGKPMLIIKDENVTFPLRMGMTKAKTILAHIEDIRNFVSLAEKK